jgi:hypothetical protein
MANKSIHGTRNFVDPRMEFGCLHIETAFNHVITLLISMDNNYARLKGGRIEIF